MQEEAEVKWGVWETWYLSSLGFPLLFPSSLDSGTCNHYLVPGRREAFALIHLTFF